VSKEEFSVCLKGFSCAALCCREIHWSYLQSMQERRVSLVPKYIEEQSVEELFDGLSSPVLTRINCSCDITFVNPEDNSEELLGSLIWDLEVLRRNSAAAVVQASAIQQEKAIDAFCHPVDLAQAECNCGNFSPSPSCLVSFMPKDERYSDSESLNLESLNLEDEEDDNSDDQQSIQSKDDLHAETFKVKGSFYATSVICLQNFRHARGKTRGNLACVQPLNSP